MGLKKESVKQKFRNQQNKSLQEELRLDKLKYKYRENIEKIIILAPFETCPKNRKHII